ncbi:hypothetical protein HELRODRAFT_169891 [Helobdella robusta]|uniref:Uncharacterized protein n=1 Tax=Helobdella robusta TaxID=6412 RepID=T1F2E8_HELRO|nr:hypothetical protein HELRODRAFT_169891 [Helobdella robusta]ESO08151.1 hypothetical protein HELRODRAFT_169891 [Helobdella robusta]
MKFHEWGVGVDPDESCWVESVKFNISFLVIVRVFFEIGPPAYEEIGCADFVPNNLDQGSQFSVPYFENFEQVFSKAASWMKHQRNINITNMQSIDYKMKNDFDASELDTQRSFFVESGRYTTKYLRILRICFTRSFKQHQSQQPAKQQHRDKPPTLQHQHTFPQRQHQMLQRQNSLQSLSGLQPPTYNHSIEAPNNPAPITECRYVTFEPMMLSSGGIIGIPLFERLSETMKRAMLWLNRTNSDVKLISAETVPVRMFSGNQYGNHEVTYTWNRGEQKEFWLLVIRLYLTGTIDVAPPDVIMPPFLNKKHHRHHGSVGSGSDEHDECCCVM